MRRKRHQQEARVITGPGRAAIYTRVSTGKQRSKPDEDNKLSLEDQEIACRKRCAERGYVVDERYVVREVSSGDFLHRPQLEEIYEAIKRGEIDLLVMYNVSRFARNSENATYHYVRAVKVHQIRIEFIDSPPSGNLEKFHFVLQSVFAEEYRDQVMKQTLEKKRERVTRRGLLLPGSWPLFGYKWDNDVKKGRYEIDEEAAAVVRRIFALAADGMTCTGICRLLNAEGVPTPSAYQRARGRLPESRRVSSYWWMGYISRLLHTPAYWGEHVAFRSAHKNVVELDQTTGKYEAYHVIHFRASDDPTVIHLSPELCPPLVEKWQAEAAHQRLAANKVEAAKHGSSQKALLRGGYILCGYCNRPMYCQSGDHRTLPAYYCRSLREKQEGRPEDCPFKGFRLHHLQIDQAVWEDIVAYFSDPDWLERILAREREREVKNAEQTSKRLQELQQALASKEAAANQLVHLATQITSDSMREKLQKQLNEVGGELDALKQEYQTLLQPPESEEKRHAQRQAFRSWAEDAIAGLSQASNEKKRLALYWLGVEVRAWHSPAEPDYELVLTWRGLNAGRPLVLHEREESGMLSHQYKQNAAPRE